MNPVVAVVVFIAACLLGWFLTSTLFHLKDAAMSKSRNVGVLELVEAFSAASSIGLAFVPDIVIKAANPEQAKRALLRACELGVIELRPDGGLSRFKQWELDAAPDGPQGSKLLWARVL